MTKKGMTDDQLLSQLETLERQATGFYGGEIASEQSKAMDYYLGKPFGTEEDGRSSVISSDVWDVVEGLTPLILKPFVASDDVVRFQPMGPDDEEAAEQESDYINFVVTQKNDVFEQLVAWVKTGLLQKNGVVKYWWETSRRTEIERYYGLSDDQMALLAQDENVEIVEHTERQEQGVDPQGQPTIEVEHDVTLRVTHEDGSARYAVIPPEEFLISRDATSVNPKLARFVEHRKIVTLSELREMGYDVSDDINDGGTEDPSFSEQYQARREADEATLNHNEGEDRSLREVVFREAYMLVDYDGDGIAELRRICRVGRAILANEETEEIPFVAWTPYQQPFKFYGRSPADETCEIQLIKSTVLRQTMDNLYTINNNRNFVSERVNLDDLLDNHIAGIVRVQGDGPVGNHVVPAPVTPIGAITLPIVEYFDGAKENRTGFTRYNQGTDSNSLNKTATGVRLITEAGNQRVEIIARSFAETGLKQLMLGIHGLCRRHATKEETVRLRGKWVNIDPRGWKTRYDMSVSVGLGSADKQMQMQGIQMLMMEQKQLAQVGIVTPENFLNAASKFAEVVGFKNPEQFFTAAQPQQAPDPRQDPSFILEATKVQHDEAKIKLDAARLMLDAKIAEANTAKGEAETALKAYQQGLDMQMQLMDAMRSMQESIASLQMQAQGQAHDQAIAQQQADLSAQGQAHSQALAEHGAMLSEQGQMHSQDMAEQAQALAGQQKATDGQA